MGCPSLRLHSTPCAEMPNCSHQVLRPAQVLMQFHSCIVAEDILDPKLILAILWRLPVALRHGLRIESFSWYLYARKCMEKNTRNTSRVSCWVHLRSCLRTVCLPTSPNPIFRPRPILHGWTGLRAFISHSELGQGANLWPQPIGLSGCGFWWKTSKHDQHNHHVWNSWVWSSALRAGSYLSWKCNALLEQHRTWWKGLDTKSLCVYIHIYIYCILLYTT